MNMGSFKNNRVVVSVFAVLMAVGLMAAYIPLLFPPSGSQNGTPEASAPTDTNNYAAQLPQNTVPAATTTATGTSAKASLPDSLSNFQTDQKSLDDINNLLK